MIGDTIAKELYDRCTKNILDIIVLVVLKDNPMLGGYDLIKILHSKFRVFLSPGTIYLTLSSLEEGDLIRGTQEQRKKVYELTEKGIKMIEVLLNNYSETQKQILRMLGLSLSV